MSGLVTLPERRPEASAEALAEAFIEGPATLLVNGEQLERLPGRSVQGGVPQQAWDRLEPAQPVQQERQQVRRGEVQAGLMGFAQGKQLLGSLQEAPGMDQALALCRVSHPLQVVRRLVGARQDRERVQGQDGSAQRREKELGPVRQVSQPALQRAPGRLAGQRLAQLTVRTTDYEVALDDGLDERQDIVPVRVQEMGEDGVGVSAGLTAQALEPIRVSVSASLAQR